MEQPETSESSTLNRTVRRGRAGLAFVYAAPIGLLGGLIGLGGAEFRLPILAGPLGYPARRAIPLNLMVSLFTLAAALLTRGRTLSLDSVAPFFPAIIAMIVGAIPTTLFGTMLLGRLSNKQLEQSILVLLVIIGSALIVEAFLPQSPLALIPNALIWRISTSIVFGLAIGLISSLLGVAGGELIIPTMIFAFGADIKTAGTASLIISLPIVLMGTIRYARQRAFAEWRVFIETVLPMGLGSVLGAVAGGSLVGFFPTTFLKVGLGIILIYSSIRIFRHASAEHNQRSTR